MPHFDWKGYLQARDPSLIAQIKSDPHSPAEFRVNGSLRNHSGNWVGAATAPAAAGVSFGSAAYAPPAMFHT